MTGWGAAGDAFDVVLIGDPAGAMADAVALAGGRVVARHPAGATTGSDGLVVVDIAGLGDPPDDGLAGADVVVCDLAQLDAVAAALLWSDAQLLCDPTPADRIEALVLAAMQATAPEATVRERDDDRLRRIGGEVGRIAGLLARLADEAGADDLADRRVAFRVEPDRSSIDPAAVRQAIRARRLRQKFFADGLFEDPAWDMLLDLFAAELEGGRVSVSSLCIAAQVAPTTALRWIGRLVDAGLFDRRPDPRDRRRAFIALTAAASAAMRGYAAALARAGLRLG